MIRLIYADTATFGVLGIGNCEVKKELKGEMVLNRHYDE